MNNVGIYDGIFIEKKNLTQLKNNKICTERQDCLLTETLNVTDDVDFNTNRQIFSSDNVNRQLNKVDNLFSSLSVSSFSGISNEVYNYVVNRSESINGNVLNK